MLIVLLYSCTGSSVLKAHRTSIFDEYFIMGAKRYKTYVPVIARIPGDKGRYAISGDTIYLLGKRTGKDYPLKGYAFADTSTGTITHKRLDSNYSKTFEIEYYRPQYHKN